MLQNPELHYLDNAATTMVAPEVADVIDKAMREHWANPSSLYGPGARSEEALNAARAAVARTLGCKPKELYFTSCGSESNNLALLGAVRTRTFGKGIVVSGFEHPSVQRPLEELAKQGYNVTVVKPRPDGTLDINEMLEHVDKNTILVACMMVNNEVGTRNDVERLAAEVKRRNSRTIVHVDAVQAWMRVPIKLTNIDTLSVSGHKIHAPKGIGALYIRRGLKLPPLIRGGGQEEGLRSGTEATAQIAAFAAAVRAGAATREADIRYMAGLKAETLARLQEAVPGLKPIGSGTAPHILAVTLPGYKSEVIVRFLSDRGICLSSGSACHKGKPSHVYAALKLPKSDLDGALRISFSYDTTQQDVDALADGLRAAKGQLFPTLS